jgi:hypothetical protein
MKTTLVIDETIVRRLHEEAARRNSTLSNVVEAALRLHLESKAKPARLPALPKLARGSARVDVANREALYRCMGGRS